MRRDSISANRQHCGRTATRSCALYLQDSWRPFAGLTLDLGFRWAAQINQDPLLGNDALIERVRGVDFPLGAFEPDRIPDDKRQWMPRAGVCLQPEQRRSTDGVPRQCGRFPRRNSSGLRECRHQSVSAAALQPLGQAADCRLHRCTGSFWTRESTSTPIRSTACRCSSPMKLSACWRRPAAGSGSQRRLARFPQPARGEIHARHGKPVDRQNGGRRAVDVQQDDAAARHARLQPAPLLRAAGRPGPAFPITISVGGPSRR